MFQISSIHRRGILFAALLVAGAFAFVAVHASASGAKAAKRPTLGARSLRLSGLAKIASLRDLPQASLKGAPALKPTVPAGATADAAALTAAGTATTVSCGQTLTASVTLSANLDCEGEDGLTLGASGITLNLDGYGIFGSFGAEDGTFGVQALYAKDTVENGYVVGFDGGVVAGGTDTAVTGLQADDADDTGIALGGTGYKATDDTAAANGLGIAAEGAGTVGFDHLLNNKGFGLLMFSRGKVLDNIADGNGIDGIFASGLVTVTGNVADFNSGYGIDANPPEIDGGSNKAMGNGKSEQCIGVVCS